MSQEDVVHDHSKECREVDKIIESSLERMIEESERMTRIVRSALDLIRNGAHDSLERVLLERYAEGQDNRAAVVILQTLQQYMIVETLRKAGVPGFER